MVGRVEVMQANEPVLSAACEAAAVRVDGGGVDCTEVTPHKPKQGFVDQMIEFDFEVTVLRCL